MRCNPCILCPRGWANSRHRNNHRWWCCAYHVVAHVASHRMPIWIELLHEWHHRVDGAVISPCGQVLWTAYHVRPVSCNVKHRQLARTQRIVLLWQLNHAALALNPALRGALLCPCPLSLLPAALGLNPALRGAMLCPCSLFLLPAQPCAQSHWSIRQGQMWGASEPHLMHALDLATWKHHEGSPCKAAQ